MSILSDARPDAKIVALSGAVFLSCTALALLTAVCRRLRLNLATVVLLYLVVVVLLSLKGSFTASAVFSFVAVFV